MKVTLDKESHKYYDEDGNELTSLSRVLNYFEQPFDEDGKIAEAVARKYNKSKEEIQREWKSKGKEATDHGTRIHDALELYDKTTLINDKELEPLIRDIAKRFIGYKKMYSEQIYYSHLHMIAGTADKPCMRVMGKNPVLDIYDYKTNLSKGIEYLSKYGKWMYFPLNHLEQCNYNRYSLQLSAYMYMAELMYKIRPGRLGIISVSKQALDKDYIGPMYKLIPVPYMRNEVEMMFNMYVADRSSGKILELDRGNAIDKKVAAEFIDRKFGDD